MFAAPFPADFDPKRKKKEVDQSSIPSLFLVVLRFFFWRITNVLRQEMQLSTFCPRLPHVFQTTFSSPRPQTYIYIGGSELAAAMASKQLNSSLSFPSLAWEISWKIPLQRTSSSERTRGGIIYTGSSHLKNKYQTKGVVISSPESKT